VCAGAGFPDTVDCPVALQDFHACYDKKCKQIDTSEFESLFFEKVDDCPGLPFCCQHERTLQQETSAYPYPTSIPIISQVCLVPAQARFCLALLTRPWHLR
jgi:hypothetical protein